MSALDIVILGLSITSSWGNGHAVTYRGLTKALARRGHRVTFLERDVPWYRDSRDLDGRHGIDVSLYGSLEELQDRHAALVRGADLVMLGSYVPDGIAVGRWITREARNVTAFYDIDTPVTLAALQRGDCEYLSAELIPEFDAYFSFTGGPTLDRLETEWGATMAVALYCSADPEFYAPLEAARQWDLGYIGTYSDDRQPALDRLLIGPARSLPDHRFVIAGPQYPAMDWPPNVERIEHLAPDQHRDFYAAQRMTLNVTRADMVRLGWSPSVRLFEAASCGVPIVSDWWPGLDEIFLPGREILTAANGKDAAALLTSLGEAEQHAIGARARARVLAEHTPENRAEVLESAVHRARAARHRSRPAAPAQATA